MDTQGRHHTYLRPNSLAATAGVDTQGSRGRPTPYPSPTDYSIIATQPTPAWTHSAPQHVITLSVTTETLLCRYCMFVFSANRGTVRPYSSRRLPVAGSRYYMVVIPSYCTVYCTVHGLLAFSDIEVHGYKYSGTRCDTVCLRTGARPWPGNTAKRARGSLQGRPGRPTCTPKPRGW